MIHFSNQGVQSRAPGRLVLLHLGEVEIHIYYDEVNVGSA